MKLDDLAKKDTAIRALKETFSINFNVKGLDSGKANSMLSKVSKLIKESKKSSEFYKTQNSPAYLKLVFMEQALSKHIKSIPATRIIVENTEVEKSQVILAAQDMVDTVQKMYEDVNDMIVKELPALVSSIQSEIGVNESTSFNQTVSDALNNLNSSLQEAKTSLQSALGGVTGQEMGDAFGGGEIDPTADMDGDDDLGLDADLGADVDTDLDSGLDDLPVSPEDDEMPLSGVGRAKR